MIASTTSLEVHRTGPSIRAVLAKIAPERCVEFEGEFRIALAEADDDFDLSRVQAVIDRWWPRAYAAVHPLTEEERAQVARFRAGDCAGLLQKNDNDGTWTEL